MPDPSRAASSPTLELKGDRLSASSGCNRASGAFKSDQGRLMIGPLAATRMACPGELERIEQAYFALLTANPTYTIEGDTLRLKADRQEARFERLPSPSPKARVRFIEVAPLPATCPSPGPTPCLHVREARSHPWQLHRGGIAGFDHQPGTAYRLRVLEEPVTDPPKGSPEVRWTLDLIVEQRIVDRR